MPILSLILSLSTAFANETTPRFTETVCAYALTSMNRQPQIQPEDALALSADWRLSEEQANELRTDVTDPRVKTSVIHIKGPRVNAFLKDTQDAIDALDVAVNAHRVAMDKVSMSANKIVAVAAGLTLGSVAILSPLIHIPEAHHWIPELAGISGILVSAAVLVPLAWLRDEHLRSPGIESLITRSHLSGMQSRAAIGESRRSRLPTTITASEYLRRDLVDQAIDLHQGELDPMLIARTIDYTHYFGWLGRALPGRVRTAVTFHFENDADGQPTLTVITRVKRPKAQLTRGPAD